MNESIKAGSVKPRQLMAFRAAMLQGSITAAAKQLNVSQPAVSRLIADLEFSLGFTLFARQANGIVPTREAQEFFREVDMMFYGLDRLTMVGEEIRTLSRATVRFASLPMLSFRVVPEAMFRFHEIYPQARVLQDVHPSARVLELVASRQVDFGAAQTHIRRDDIEILHTYHTRCVCVMAKDHPLAGARVLTPEALRDQPLIALARHTVTASYIANAFHDAGISPNIIAESQPSYAAGSLAAVGRGIAFIDQLTALALDDRVAVIPFEPMIPFDISILKPRETPLSRAAEGLLKEIKIAMVASLERAGRHHNIFT